MRLFDWLRKPRHKDAAHVRSDALFDAETLALSRLVEVGNAMALLRNKGKYGEALPFAQQAEHIARQHLGKNHRAYGVSLTNLAGLFQAMGNYAAAEPLYHQTLEIYRVALGEHHPDYSLVLNNLAALYRAMGDYEAAEPLYHQALEICRSAVGEHHPDYATSLNNLAVLYQVMGNYAAALPLMQRAQEFCLTSLGELHPDYATSLNNLATLYDTVGEYAAAEPLYKKALEIRRQTLGKDHPSYAVCLDNLAALYRTKGDYASALPLFQEAGEILRVVLGKGHPSYATSLNNIAVLYRGMGDYATAEALCRQALIINGETLGENHPTYATSLDNLAVLYRMKGDYVSAESLYKKALEIRRLALGEAHPDFVTSLNNVAEMHLGMGDYAGTIPLLQQAREVCRTSLGERHPVYAISLNNLAAPYILTGSYAAAEPLLLQAAEVSRAAVGKDHPQFADSLNNLAVLYAATGRTVEALALLEQAAAVDDRMIGQVFSIASEGLRTMFADRVRINVDKLLSLVWRHFMESTEAVRTAVDLVLRRKAIGAEVLASQRDAVLSGRYTGLRAQLQELSTLRSQIAQKTLAGPGAEGLQDHERLLKKWSGQREQLESRLAQQIPEMNLELKLRAADRRVVSLSLPEGGVLVEYVRFDVFDFNAVAARDEPFWLAARYLAFILPSGGPDDVRMIDLGESEPIDRLITNFRAGILNQDSQENDRDMVKRPTRRVTAQTHGRIGRSLRALVFDKLALDLKKHKRIFIAPDGSLARLPFGVLPTEDSRHLQDEFQISYVSCGRDVLRFGATSGRRASTPLVVCDPDFDLSAVGTGSSSQANHARGRRSRDLDDAEYHFARLPATRLEGEQVAERLGAYLWQGTDALEGRLRQHCRSPRILHLATHGFFLEDQRQGFGTLHRSLGLLVDTVSGSSRLSGPLPENPLLRSGLALAGANTWLRRGSLPAEAEDGLLTAEDVTGLDLLDTDLAVLSACETGLGDIRISEGVFGLRRAFVLAGAKTLVISLWKVPDEPTRELMEDFYRRILAGQGRAESLRDAQLVMKVKYPEPFYWGAFICQGDPGRLSHQK